MEKKIFTDIIDSSLRFYQERLFLEDGSFKTLDDRLNFCIINLNKKRLKFGCTPLKREDLVVKINSSIDADPTNSHLLLEFNLENELIKQVSVPTLIDGKRTYKGFCFRHDKLMTDFNPIKNLREFNRYFGAYFDGHDVETSDHRKRVGVLSKYLSDFLRDRNYFRKLHMNHDLGISSNSREFGNILNFASMNHDDGKVFIPYEILNKPSSLTPEEFNIMKKHAIYGGILLDSIPGLEFSKEIAGYHHEKYNGGGYFGLSGEEIHISAQITTFVDIFDALTTPRVYRNGKSYSYEKAYSMLFEGFDDNFRGSSYTFNDTFNPEIYKIILKRENWDKFVDYHKKIIKLKKF